MRLRYGIDWHGWCWLDAESGLDTSEVYERRFKWAWPWKRGKFVRVRIVVIDEAKR